MRVLFAGSPTVALPTLEALVDSPHELVGVLTQPARPSGRKKLLADTPVAEFATSRKIPLATPRTAAEVVDTVGRWSPEIAIVVAYGRLLGATELESVPHGWWNVHFSLLPRWRGAAPVPHALAAGDRQTGVTLFRIDEGLDSGPIASSHHHVIAPHDTSVTLLDKLSQLAPGMVTGLLESLQKGSLELRDQSGEPTFAPKPDPSTGEIEWTKDAAQIYNLIRAWAVEPGCFATRSDSGARVKIVEAWPAPDHAPRAPGSLALHPEGVLVGTGTVPLMLARVQPSGKSDMRASDWWRGLPEGVSFGV